MRTVGQGLTPAWETEDKATGTRDKDKKMVLYWAWPTLLVTAGTIIHKCCLGNSCRPHGREGPWSCAGYYPVGHLKGLGNLQRRN